MALRKNAHPQLIIQSILILWIIGATLNKLCAKIKKLKPLPKHIAHIWIIFMIGGEVLRYIINNYRTLDNRIIQDVITPLLCTGIIAALSAFLISFIHQQVVGKMRG